jgi:hypothetical protein
MAGCSAEHAARHADRHPCNWQQVSYTHPCMLARWYNQRLSIASYEAASTCMRSTNDAALSTRGGHNMHTHASSRTSTGPLRMHAAAHPATASATTVQTIVYLKNDSLRTAALFTQQASTRRPQEAPGTSSCVQTPATPGAAKATLNTEGVRPRCNLPALYALPVPPGCNLPPGRRRT